MTIRDYFLILRDQGPIETAEIKERLLHKVSFPGPQNTPTRSGDASRWLWNLIDVAFRGTGPPPRVALQARAYARRELRGLQ